MTSNRLAKLITLAHAGLASLPLLMPVASAQAIPTQPPAEPYTDARAQAANAPAIASAQAADQASAAGLYMTPTGVTSFIAAQSPVQSVAGRTGAVVLGHGDLSDWATVMAPYALASAIPSLTGYLTASAAAAAYQPLGSYATTSALTTATSGLLSSATAAAAYTPTTSLSPVALASNVGALTYLHHYAAASMTVPAVGLGAIGTGTILIVAGTVPAPAVGDLCIVSPTSATTALGYMIGTGWVTTAGTVKVSLEAGTLVAISAGSLGVNVLCGQ